MSSPQQSEPPPSVSHTDDAVSATVEPTSRVIRIQPMAMIGVVLFLFAVSFPVAGSPRLFGWMLLLPVLLAYWIARVRTTVTPEGLTTRKFVGSRTIPWTDVRGLRFPKRGWARADLGGGAEAVLPAVSIDDLLALSAASGGIVPDPTPPEVSDDEVLDRDDETADPESGPAADDRSVEKS